MTHAPLWFATLFTNIWAIGLVAILVIFCMTTKESKPTNTSLLLLAGAVSTWSLVIPLAGWIPETALLGYSGRPIGGDYAAFYTAALMASEKGLAETYDVATYQQYGSAIFGKHAFTWQYPPTVTMLVYPLAQLPFALGAFLWTTLPIVALAITLWRIGKTTGEDLMLLLLLPTIWINLNFGQTGTLLATILLGAVADPNKHLRTGLLICLLTLKPQLGLLLPIYLIGTKQYKATFYAVIGTLTLVGVSSLIYGIEAWFDWLRLLADAPARVQTVLPGGPFTSWYAMVKNVTANDTAGSIATATSLMIAVALAIATVSNKEIDHKAKTSIIVTLTLLVSPYIMVYDWVILIIPLVLSRETLLQNNWGKAYIATALLSPFPLMLAWFTPNPYIHIGGIYAAALALFIIMSFALTTRSATPHRPSQLRAT